MGNREMGEKSEKSTSTASFFAIFITFCICIQSFRNCSQIHRLLKKRAAVEPEIEIRSQQLNCWEDLKFFNKSENRPRIAISSFPGSGNTWARHLIHKATGYWTGNRRSSKQLKDAGWLA